VSIPVKTRFPFGSEGPILPEGEDGSEEPRFLNCPFQPSQQDLAIFELLQDIPIASSPTFDRPDGLGSIP
jgi:hypothetical protein